MSIGLRESVEWYHQSFGVLIILVPAPKSLALSNTTNAVSSMFCAGRFMLAMMTKRPEYCALVGGIGLETTAFGPGTNT